MTAAVHIQAARKVYPTGLEALKDVSFDVAPGDFFALLGPNGAGKTTLISAMAGLSRLTSGTIRVAGHDVVGDAYAARRALGLVPQELVFDPFFSVREALRFQSGYFGIKNNDDWIDEILANLGLSDKATTNSRNLSGGMKRRLMVALALVHRPEVIVLDEPTAGVDIELRQSLWAFIESLNRQGHTIILTTHYLEEAQALCNRVAMLKQGTLITLEDTATLLQNDNVLNMRFKLSDRLPESLALLKSGEEADGAVLLKLPDTTHLEAVLGTLRQHRIEVEEMELVKTDLEDIFLKLTGSHNQQRALEQAPKGSV